MGRAVVFAGVGRGDPGRIRGEKDAQIHREPPGESALTELELDELGRAAVRSQPPERAPPPAPEPHPGEHRRDHLAHRFVERGHVAGPSTLRAQSRNSHVSAPSKRRTTTDSSRAGSKLRRLTPCRAPGVRSSGSQWVTMPHDLQRTVRSVRSPQT